MFEKRIVKRLRDGSYELKLPDGERQMLQDILPQLKQALEGDAASDPAFKRLFPKAYVQDPEHEAEYQALVGDELIATRVAHVDAVLTTIRQDRLTEEEVFAWMGAVNDLRLVLGTRLDVSEETDLAVDPTDPEAPAYGLYAYLGWLLELLVEAVSA